MLVELSNYSVPPQTTDCFLKLGDCGMTAVLTHPERNPILRETPQRVVEGAEQGCVIQITGSALTGCWGHRRLRGPQRCFKRNPVHAAPPPAPTPTQHTPTLP